MDPRVHTTIFTQGFSTLETLVAVMIGVFVSVMLMLSIIPGFRVLTEMTRKESVYSAARHITDSLSYQVRRGSVLTSTGPNNVSIIHYDGTTILIEESAGKVLMNGAAISPSNVVVEEVNFTVFPRSVRLAFAIKGEGEIILYATSTVALRN